MASNYDNSSIDLQVGAARIRLRPASMLGSDGLDGARHGFTEIYGNAVDEKTPKMIVSYYKDGSVSLRDFGRGVPLGWNDKPHVQNWNWHIIYNELYGGGKFDTNQEELAKITDWDNFDESAFNYLYSVGLNGLGAASTQYTSEFFEVRSYRDGKCTSRSFKSGIPLVNNEPVDMFVLSRDEILSIPEEIEDTDESDGTYIHWKPDSNVFSDINIGADWLFETCRSIANITHTELIFNDEESGREIIIPAGDLKTLATEIGGSAILKDDSDNMAVYAANNFTHGNINVKGKPFIYVCKCSVIISVTKRNVDSKCFHNSVFMQSGVQYDGIHTAISDFLSERARARGVKLERSDFNGVFNVVVSSYSNHASFRGQTKDGVDDVFILSLIRETIYNKLNIEFGKGTPAILEAVERVINEAELRAELREQEKLIRANKSISREKISIKFLTCEAYREKRYEEAELWICEGDSAKGTLKTARNSKFQAIYPIRGKGLNVAKWSLKRILANKEIREIFALIGTGFDLNIAGEQLFDIKKLKFGKIILATDADEDGYQIRMLLFMTFYLLAPELITRGIIYIAETPRFMVTLSNGDVKFALNQPELEEILKEFGGGRVQRFKGLGEANASDLRSTTVLPESRNLVPVTCDFDNEAEREWIDALFGADKFKQRKSILQKCLGYDADLFNENIDLFNQIDAMEFEEETEYVEI